MTTKIYKNLIAGKWVSAAGGKTFLNHNPANVDDVVGEFQASGEADVDRAVKAARAAYRQWRLVPAPAPVTADIAQRAQALAVGLAGDLEVVGTLTVELFLAPDGSLVVNELAPRVHNSGHWTIDGAATSQFAQHIRAICGLPLGDPAAHGAAAMINLLGRGERRPAQLAGVAEALSDPAAHLHLYDKRQGFERRKMGHLTVLAGTPEEALARAERARDLLSWA